jgi:ribulose-phosphate 3-epimerase
MRKNKKSFIESGDLLDKQTKASLKFTFYCYRFLINYIIIGALSICVEILIIRALAYFGTHFILAVPSGIGIGILFSFWFNVRFNFKVPVGKRHRAFLFFSGISIGSACLNFIFRNQLVDAGLSYEVSRFMVAGLLFSIAYGLHRKFSFKDMKQVGVAVYANGIEDIKLINSKIGPYPDFIHVDLIDKSFSETGTDVRAYRLETISAYWPNKHIQVHLMSRNPMAWLDDILPYADTIIVHAECDEDLSAVIKKIKDNGKSAGLCLLMKTPIDVAKRYLDEISTLMLLTIQEPGKSGQKFEMEGLQRIEQIKSWEDRKDFVLCIDGGVSEENIHLLNVELVVSGSSVLKNADPARQIMRLQTSNNYEPT